jgi:GNAT superfamily N-acetyltransferase
MVLSANNIEWLRELPGTVHESELEAAYSFEHPLNQSRRLVRETLSLDAGDANLLWWIEFRTAEQEEILDPPLARRIFKDTALASASGNGPVAQNALFMVKEQFRSKGLAKSLYEGELQLYKKWGLKEIHISARDEGCVVWPKKFGFIPRAPRYLEENYVEWARRRHIELPATLPNVSDYPEEFLRSRKSLDLYKVIS